MNRTRIGCASCRQTWVTGVAFSVYVQQAIESSPCPHCGAYTLCCQAAREASPGRRGRRDSGSILRSRSR